MHIEIHIGVDIPEIVVTGTPLQGDMSDIFHHAVTEAASESPGKSDIPASLLALVPSTVDR